MKTNCIIIGNGQSALNYKAGLIIDSYPKVIRLNNFVITGHETCIGTKTDIWANINHHNIEKKLENEYKTILVLNAMRPIDYEKFPGQHVINSILDIYGILKKLNITFPDNLCPSTGLHAVLYFIELTGPVTYYGFDYLKTGHYFDPECKHWSGHNGNAEEHIFLNLESKGLLFKLENVYNDL